MNIYSDDQYQHTQRKVGGCGYSRFSGRSTECPKCKLGEMYDVKENDNLIKCNECGFKQLKPK